MDSKDTELEDRDGKIIERDIEDRNENCIYRLCNECYCI